MVIAQDEENATVDFKKGDETISLKVNLFLSAFRRSCPELSSRPHVHWTWPLVTVRL